MELTRRLQGFVHCRESLSKGSLRMAVKLLMLQQKIGKMILPSYICTTDSGENRMVVCKRVEKIVYVLTERWHTEV